MNQLRIQDSSRPIFSDAALRYAGYGWIAVDRKKNYVELVTTVWTVQQTHAGQDHQESRHQRCHSSRSAIGWASLREYCETHGCTGQSHGMASDRTQVLSEQATMRLQPLKIKRRVGLFPALPGGSSPNEISETSARRHTRAYSWLQPKTNKQADGTYRAQVQVRRPTAVRWKIKDQKGKDVKDRRVAREAIRPNTRWIV